MITEATRAAIKAATPHLSHSRPYGLCFLFPLLPAMASRKF